MNQIWQEECVDKIGSFGFAYVLAFAFGGKDKCANSADSILKFLRAGKVPVESTKFSCHG